MGVRVVGIGASAGGLGPLESVLGSGQPPADSAFVVVQHLPHDSRTYLSEILSRVTRLTVQLLSDATIPAAGVVYIVPPSHDAVLQNGKLCLRERERIAPQRSIDRLFVSLASQGNRAAVLVLSGTGQDGQMGAQAVWQAGGIVLVQRPDTAQFDGMPSAVMNTGDVSGVAAPEQLMELLSELIVEREGKLSTELRSVFSLLGQAYGVDFSQYKSSTIVRRIQRRIELSQQPDVRGYLDLLDSKPEELDSLFKDLLIGVTSFFRDMEVFSLLQTEVLARMVSEQKEIRIWVPGCASGEEVFSLAILLCEEMERANKRPDVKIFGTDVHPGALMQAQGGVYTEEALTSLPVGIRDKYLVQEKDRWVVRAELRRMALFTRHDLLQDPPFTKLDLVSCRNVLIYFEQIAQNRALSLFLFALKPRGILVLGPSETLGSVEAQFSPLSPKLRVFRKMTEAPLLPAFQMSFPRAMLPVRNQPSNHLLQTYDAILETCVAAGFLLNDRNEIIHLFGEARDAVRPPPGRFHNDILEWVEGELRAALMIALQRVKAQKEPVVLSRIPCLLLGGTSVRLTAKILSVRGVDHPPVLVTLVPDAPEELPRAPGDVFDPQGASSARVLELETELRSLRETLQNSIQESDITSAELQAANEELQSSNEELQSVNEELHSVNAVLRRKVEQLTELTNDMENLLASTDIGTLFIDRALKIRRFTPTISSIFNLIDSDLGRPIDQLAPLADIPNLLGELRAVLGGARPMDIETRNRDGRFLLVGFSPYTVGGKVEGAVVTVRDIHELGQAINASRNAELLLQRALDTMHVSIAILGEDGTILRVNKAWEDFSRANGGKPDKISAGVNYIEVCERAVGPNSEEAATVAAGLRALARGEIQNFSTNYPCHSFSQERFFRLNATAVRTEERTYLVVTHENVTAHVLLSTTHERLSTVLDQTDDAILVEGGDGTISYWNSAATNLLGFSPREALGRSIAFLFPHGDASEETALLQHLASTRKSTRFDRTLRHKNGHLLQVSVTMSPLFDVEQGFAGASLVFRPRDNSTQERAMRTFVAKMSHELRTPLNAILGMTEIVLDSNLSQDQHRNLSVIHSSAEGLLALIGDILDFSRLDTGRIVLQHRLFNVHQVLQDLALLMSARADAKGLDLLVQVAPDVPQEILGDSIRFRQVVLNLVGNAIKFTSTGCVLLSLSCLGRAGTEIRLKLDVEDTGPGIAQEHVERIFMPFEQIGDSRGGTGLGLAIVRQLVEAMRGSVSVKSEEGKGSVFSVTFLFGVNSPQRTADSPLSGRSYLVIDTKTRRRDFLEDVLGQAGASVVSVSSIEEGLLAASKQPFSCAIFPSSIGLLPALQGPRVVLVRSDDSPPAGVTALRLPLLSFAVIDVLASSLEINPPSTRVTRPLRLLLVDDNPINQRVLARLVEKLGHVTHLAADGSQALEILEQQQFDAVLMDVQMPVMDGLQATRLLREREKLSGKHTHIIGVTASVAPTDRSECIDAGMDAFLNKPIRAADIEQELAKVKLRS